MHTLANEVQIFEDGTLIAAHPVLEGRNQRAGLPPDIVGWPSHEVKTVWGPRSGTPVGHSGAALPSVTSENR